MKDTESLATARTFLGKRVHVVMDRPMGTNHPKHGFVHEANYGYVPNTQAPDGEELDAYYLGTDERLNEAEGVCLAIIHRANDDDDKLVVVPGRTELTDNEILDATVFQEQWFDSVVVR